MARRLGRRSHALTLLGNLANPALDIGDWDWLAAELETAHDDETDEFARNYLSWALLAIAAWRGEDADDEVVRLTAWAKGFNDFSAEESIHEQAISRQDWRVVYDEAIRFAASDKLNSRRAYGLAGMAALLLGDAVRAREALDLLTASGVHGSYARMDEKLMLGGIAALDGQTGAALAEFRETLAGLTDLGLEFRVAIAGLAMAAVLPADVPEVRAAVDAARSTFTRLRAKPLLGALDRAGASVQRSESQGGTQRPAKSSAAVPAP